VPIFEQRYRTFDGEVVRRFRWWTVVQQETRLLWTTRVLRSLMFPTIVHVISMALWILLIDLATLLSGQSLQMAPGLAQAAASFSIEPDLFRVFIQRQAFFVFLMVIAAGSGFIGNDFKYNLVGIYFSKPLSWLDYVMGKVVTLILVGFAASLFPAVFLIVIHFIFDPTWDSLKSAVATIVPAILFSVALVIPCALGILASSSIFYSARLAGIAVFLILIVNTFFGTAFVGITLDQRLAVISFPVAINRIGESAFGLFFEKTPTLWEVSWPISLAYVSGVSALMFGVVCLKVRRAGAAA
jgi:ABC-type transport system involved in multi-copper enzyme maturation permease subunit